MTSTVENSFSGAIAYTTAVGLSLSMVFLISYLLLYYRYCEETIVNNGCKFRRKLLVFLCFSFLITYLSFIVGLFVGEYTFLCSIAGSVTHFGFLVAYTLLLSILTDICLAIMAKDYDERKKLLVYCVCCLVWPGLFVTASVIVGTLPQDSIDQEYRPQFSAKQQGYCWFSDGKSFSVFFVVPVLIIFLFQLIVYVTNWIMARRRTTSGEIQDFVLYQRLAAFTWITYSNTLLAVSFDDTFIWICFGFIHALQGLFILFTFTPWVTVIQKVNNRSSQLTQDDLS